MVRETRHLWVGNLPDNIREDRIKETFKRYGRVQSIKLLPRVSKEETGEITMACTVAFMDIKSASKAHNADVKIDERTLNTEYYEPAAIPSAASSSSSPLQSNSTPSPGGAGALPAATASSGGVSSRNGSSSSSSGSSSTPAPLNTAPLLDDHTSFVPDRFYERPSSRVAPETEFIRRTGYHEPPPPSRSRARSYRNGPYSSGGGASMDRRTTNSWAFDTRYPTTPTPPATNQSDTGYNNPIDAAAPPTAPPKKKTKSRSGSRSASPNSTSSRSPSRSRSSSSSSSTSSTTSSNSSPKNRRQNATTNPTNCLNNTPSEDRRPLAICVKNLPQRSSDTSLKDGLFHEYKKHGKVTWVKVVGQSSDRYAIVCFKKPEDVEKALEVSYDKLFFGCKIEVAPHAMYDVEDNDMRPYDPEIDEFHPKATRTLFIGNLEKEVTASELRKQFDQFGEIIEIDIKKQGVISSYAFCQYSDIVSVVKAIRKMDGEHLGNNRIKLGFGKSMPTNCVWVDGVGDTVTEKYLRMQFEPFGVISKLHVARDRGQALIFYEQVVSAQSAVNKMRGFCLKSQKIQVDFASRECQESFFEHLDKQGGGVSVVGGVVGAFEERRDSTSSRFSSRYETPTRPRTASYSRTLSGQSGTIPSPGTPGSVTPRRSRAARFAEYYDSTVAAGDYDRHFRNYDEYSQGSGASHDEPYDEYSYPNSPGHMDALDARLQGAEGPIQTTFAPPDIRNLQKERVHLLEQLEECPSSGDELISPKKRLKLDLLDGSVVPGDVIIEANRDHRKVMEVHRLSDLSSLKHHRRPSIDSKHSSGHYIPHAVCKRRKTASSDGGVAAPPPLRPHHYDHSGSESVGGSRPGTPLCDERPENFQPSEPRRLPRDREGPLTLPLPRFAAQLMNQRGSISIAGIKGQKDVLSSPPAAAATSPRVIATAIPTSTSTRPPSPVHVPPPASPPPRPPSLSSNSSDSDAATPPSPSLEERIKSLNEKYERWSGSRALSAAGGDALATLDANREKFRQRHKLLDLDLKEIQPSEIVKSVMAKRSVFDEDLKRLENVGEKYEPKEFGLFASRVAPPSVPVANMSPVVATTVVSTPPPPATSLSSSAATPTTGAEAPSTPVPASAPATLNVGVAATTPPTSLMSTTPTIPAAKGLQYPFPSHPPLPSSPVVAPSPPLPPPPPPPPPISAPPVALLPPPPPPVTTAPSVAPSTTTAATTVSSSSCTVTSSSNLVVLQSSSSRSISSSSHGDHNKLKSCASASSDNRTSSKNVVNRTEVLMSTKVGGEKISISSTTCTSSTNTSIGGNNNNIPEELNDGAKYWGTSSNKEECKRKERDNHILETAPPPPPPPVPQPAAVVVTPATPTPPAPSKSSTKEREDKPSSTNHDLSNRRHRDNNVSSSSSRHVDDKQRSFDNALGKTQEPGKRKERNNSLTGSSSSSSSKRRLSSSHDEPLDDVKRLKKLSERRDSKEKKSHSKNNSTSSSSSRKDRDREDHRHKSKHQNRDKPKKSKESSSSSTNHDSNSPKSPLTDKDFLARLELRSNEDLSDKSRKKDNKYLLHESSKPNSNKTPLVQPTHNSIGRSEDLPTTPKLSEDRNKQQHRKERIRKLTQNSSDNTDSDEPKKHSIFDIVDDEPAYISMYDKVKARSCKNMQKQEEEKRQEKIKATFSQLKQSRAKREEKKRSTSWDEDSDSSGADSKPKRPPKLLASSDEDMKTFKKSYTDSDSDRCFQRTSKLESSDEERVIKKTKAFINSDSSDDEFKKIKSEIFSDVEDHLNFVEKKERRVGYTNSRHFGDTSDEEAGELKKERSDRKKHKKKQKRQKHSISSEESVVDGLDKKKQHNKKEKKRDKSKERERDKSKKSKKKESSSANSTTTKEQLLKRDGKMENIFGSLSEDSDVKEPVQDEAKPYNSESDHDKEHKKRKERKRREKERRAAAAAPTPDINENSMDYADMGKQLEANIKDESSDHLLEEITVKTEPSVDSIDESFRCFESNDFPQQQQQQQQQQHKEAKEKKKKRKKSKEEKQKHHHHHHHHHEKKCKSPELKVKEEPAEVDVEAAEPPTKSLPNILDIPSPKGVVVTTPPNEPKITVSTTTTTSSPCDRLNISPPTIRDVISPIPKTPTTSKDKKRPAEKLLPTFGDIDEKLHESAVKSICEDVKVEVKEELPVQPVQEELLPPPVEEKPRVVISQEETEDAVAALLGESFGEQFDDCYPDEINPTNEEDPATTLVEEESLVQDDEEMRQAVQNLSSTDLDVKPETPQSEHELQIDTDTEEAGEELSGVRFDQPPKTPDIVEECPKTPDVPALYKAPPNKLNSPPSLTPIKPAVVPEAKKEDVVVKSLPMLPEQNRTGVIAANWTPAPPTKKEVVTPPPQPLKVVRAFTPAPCPVKISEASTCPTLSPLTPAVKPPEVLRVSPIAVVQAHNLPPCSPVVQVKQTMANLLPLSKITVVTSPKPMQPTAVIRPQSSKILEPPKLVATASGEAVRLPQQFAPIGAAAPLLRPYYLPKKDEVPTDKVIPTSLVTSVSTPQASTVGTSALTVTSSAMPVIQEAPSAPVVVVKPPLPDPPKDNHLNVIQEVQRTSPSPVIVTNAKEEPPQKLAIEAVTEELNLSLLKKEPSPEPQPKQEPDQAVSVIKEVEKFDNDEKADSESVTSDLSKERSSADILTKDDQLDNKEDSDYWSAKEVNIDSVIKTLCSADELSDHSSEWFDDQKCEVIKDEKKIEEDEGVDDDVAPRGGAKRGGRQRGRKTGRVIGSTGIQTRRGKLTTPPSPPPKRGGRGAGRCASRSDRKTKSESESMPSTNDVYEFRDDSDESKERPRLILTIKSPVVGVAASPPNEPPPSEVVPAVVVPAPVPVTVAPPVVEVEEPVVGGAIAPPTPEEFVSPAANTRKSRRLQERDISRNTVDDTIEDVVKNTVLKVQNNAATRRSGRQVVAKVPETRKSPRGGRKKDRRASDPSTDDSDEKPSPSPVQEEPKAVEVIKEEPVKVEVPVVQTPTLPQPVKEKPHEGVKAAMLRRLKGEQLAAAAAAAQQQQANHHEPTNLIDPVTGLLIPMRECEEGRYIPLPNERKLPQPLSVITQPPAKPQSLKAHVLNSQAAKAATQQPLPPKPATPLSITISLSQPPIVHVSPRTPAVPKPLMKVKPSQLSPTKLVSQPQHPQHVLNAQLAHLKPAHQVNLQHKPAVIITQNHHPAPMHPALPSPPLTKAQTPIIQPPGKMEPPPKLDVTSVMMAQQRTLSPQGRLPPQPAALPPGFEASLHGERSLYNRSRSPPPAHQNSPSPQGVPISYSPPTRAPYVQQMIFQHMIRQPQQQQAYHLPRSPMIPGGLEKPDDGHEGAEAPVTSPPLELRRPGSVGLALTNRGGAPVVPHSLHSPHDRATDSPQMGQVYNVHTTRMPQHYHLNRYYESAEPPPAHRPLSSLSIPALGVNMGAAGGGVAPPPDRHLQANHNHMTTLSAVERPISGLMGAGLGAAGNFMGAVARHVGADAPAPQRGVQAATPPHASQVPAQAKSLFILLQQYPCMWQGLLALKNDQAAVQMYFVSGNDQVAKCSLPKNSDGSTPPLRIAQRMRLEPPQMEGLARKMQMENEHCMLLALPCGHDPVDVLKQSTNLLRGFIIYLQQKQAAGIINVAAPGTSQPPAYVVHIFPSCNFVNENLRRIAPSLLERVADIAHLLIVITTV